jgi:hypothetical protein
MQLQMGNYIMFMFKNDGAGKDAGMVIACSKVHSRILLKELRKTSKTSG